MGEGGDREQEFLLLGSFVHRRGARVEQRWQEMPGTGSGLGCELAPRPQGYWGGSVLSKNLWLQV